MPSTTRLLAASLSLCALTLIGCSAGGSGGGSSAPSPPISVSISPTAATIDGNNPINFTATVANNPNNNGVSWSVSGNNTEGTLSNATKTSVTYTAPAPPPLGPFIVYVTASSVAEPGKTAIATISIADALATDFGNVVAVTVGSPYSVQLTGRGGIPPYDHFTITSGSLPPCLTLSSSGLLSSINGAAPTGSCVGEYIADIQFTDSGTPTPLTTPPGELVMTVQRPTITLRGNVPQTATVGLAYTGGTLTAIGGAGAVTYAVSSGTIPPGLSVSASTGAITGTPTAAGTFMFFVTATDAYGDTALQRFQITVNPSNLSAALKGTYACTTTGMLIDQHGQTTPWAAAFSIVADGQGNITSGAEDLSDATTDTVNTLTGTYNLSNSGSGTAAIVETTTTGSPIDHTTRNWAIVAPPSPAPMPYFLMLDTDIPAPNYTGANGAAHCYLADPSAFTASTLNHSFVFGLHGINAPNTAYESTAEAEAGRFDASSSAIANGYLEDAIGGGSSPELVTFTGSFSTLDPSTGRSIATLTRSYHNATSTQQLALYFIDSTHALAVDIGPWNGLGGRILTGELRLQKQSSWSTANASGSFVLYSQGSDLTNTNGNFPVTGSYGQLLHGSTDSRGDVTLDRTFRNDSGTFTSSANTTTSVILGFDSTNPGRATLLIGATPLSLYFFDNNQAFELAETSTTVEFGRFEGQTQTATGNVTPIATYLLGQLQPMPEQKDVIASLTFNSTNPETGSLDAVTSSGATLGNLITTDFSFDPLVVAAGTFGLSNSLTTGQSSCALLTSTKFVCIPQTDTSPYIFIGQQ